MSVTYAIEKNVPIKGKRKKVYAKYPFKEMEIGDSFFVPTEGEGFADVDRRVRQSAWKYTQQTKARFTIRRTNDGGLRVWRTE